MRQVKIALTERQTKALKQQCQKLGISLAELVRRILDQHLDGNKQ